MYILLLEVKRFIKAMFFVVCDVCLILLCNTYMRTRHHCYMVGNIDITTLYAFHLLNDLFLDAPKSLVGMVLGVVYLHTNASLAMPVIRTLLSVGA